MPQSCKNRVLDNFLPNLIVIKLFESYYLLKIYLQTNIYWIILYLIIQHNLFIS